MQHFCASWLFGVSLSVLGIGLTNIRVAAQMTYTFDAAYNVSSTSIPVTSNVSATTISGESSDAPYGLTNVSGLTYTQTDLSGYYKAYHKAK